MPEDNKARIREFIDRVITAGEIDATGDYFHSDVVEEVPFPGQGPGLHGLKETLTRIRRAFSDMKWSVEEQIADESKVLTRFIWSGTHQGEFLVFPLPTGLSGSGEWLLIGLRTGRSSRPASSWIP